MRLSKEEIKEFKDIYYQEFGEKIPDEKAQLIGEGLLLLFEAIYPPHYKDRQQKLENESGDKPQ